MLQYGDVLIATSDLPFVERRRKLRTEMETAAGNMVRWANKNASPDEVRTIIKTVIKKRLEELPRDIVKYHLSEQETELIRASYRTVIIRYVL